MTDPEIDSSKAICLKHEQMVCEHEREITTLKLVSNAHTDQIGALSQSIDALHKKQDTQTKLLKPGSLSSIVSALYVVYQIVQGFLHG